MRLFNLFRSKEHVLPPPPPVEGDITSVSYNKAKKTYSFTVRVREDRIYGFTRVQFSPSLAIAEMKANESA